ncbi:hypothetical protein FRC06_002695 [Ceratobasidium sp. 370]|nr:hypothetical protein FRC06_002695 [Ceratobasidium sp. 370]
MYYDSIRALIARLFDLAPQPPVPLQACSPPATSIPLANFGLNLDPTVSLPSVPGDPPCPTFGGYGSIQNPTSFNYPPTMSYPPAHPAIPNDMSWDWLDNLEKTRQVFAGQAESESWPRVVSQLPESTSLPAADSGAPHTAEQALDTLNQAEVTGNGVRQPPDAATSTSKGTKCYHNTSNGANEDRQMDNLSSRKLRKEISPSVST